MMSDNMIFESNKQPESGKRYVAGLDWGVSPDYTCVVVIDASNNQLCLITRFNQIGYEVQRNNIRAIYNRWQLASIWSDAVGIGLANIEALQSEGLPVRSFMMTASNKRGLIESLLLSIERGDIMLPSDIKQKVKDYPGHPGEQDDVVIAMVLSWYGILHGNVRVDFA